jgi:hypothetical protein
MRRMKNHLTSLCSLRRSLTLLAVTSLVSLSPWLRAADTGYVAHEWGTFTSIQGSDGVLLDWNGIATSDLPEFVYNWSRPGLKRFDTTMLTKASLNCLQRMETPVIYFYPDKPMSVDVTVEFPKGKIAEWFPQARDVGPSTRPPNPVLAALDSVANRVGVHPNPSLAARFGDQPITNSVIHWSNFDLMPASQQPELANQMPASRKASHYFAARETESAFVRADSLETAFAPPEVEKFLFYRGVGNFQTPLKVTMLDQDQATVANTGGASLKHLFVLKVQGDLAAFVSLGDLAATKSFVTRVDFSRQAMPLVGAVAQLGKQMAAALESEGLYRGQDLARCLVRGSRRAYSLRSTALVDRSDSANNAGSETARACPCNGGPF